MPYKEKVYAHVTLAQAERFWAFVIICDHGETCQECCWKWSGHKGHKGYGSYSTWTNNKPQTWIASRLMWLLSSGDIPVGLCVLHQCDVPPCCNPAHLWLGTYRDNNNDSLRKGRRPVGAIHPARVRPETVRRGQHHGMAKLTDAQVRAIRALGGTMRLRDIGAQFGVSESNVSMILRRTAWTHLPDEEPRHD